MLSDLPKRVDLTRISFRDVLMLSINGANEIETMISLQSAAPEVAAHIKEVYGVSSERLTQWVNGGLDLLLASLPEAYTIDPIIGLGSHQHIERDNLSIRAYIVSKKAQSRLHEEILGKESAVNLQEALRLKEDRYWAGVGGIQAAGHSLFRIYREMLDSLPIDVVLTTHTQIQSQEKVPPSEREFVLPNPLRFSEGAEHSVSDGIFAAEEYIAGQIAELANSLSVSLAVNPLMAGDTMLARHNYIGLNPFLRKLPEEARKLFRKSKTFSLARAEEGRLKLINNPL